MEKLIGKWIKVNSTGYMGGFSTSGVYIGVLDDIDDGFLYLAQPNGETACLPRSTIIEVIEISTPGPSDLLLRPASAPPDQTLLRPAGAGEREDPRSLLRPIKHR